MSNKDTLPIPIMRKDDGDYECLCKNCKPSITYDHLHCWLWTMCNICKKRVWHNCARCTLYAWRKPQMICFYCRYPYYQQGMTSGEIHRLLLKQQ
jgi:hypothetical protein